MEKEFEDYWKRNRQQLIAHAPAALREERERSGNINTVGDWLLLIIPVAFIIWFSGHGFFQNELLNYLVAAALGIIVFFIANILKPLVTGKRNVIDVDEDIKQHFYKIYQQSGLQDLPC